MVKTYSRPTRVVVIAVVGCVLAACNSNQQSDSRRKTSPHAQHKVAGRDLGVDESRGGHTLRKHVGRSDEDLRTRLRREREIAAASTYTDRHTAETFIAACLDDNEGRVREWLAQDRHPNLAIDCVGDPAWPIGRSLRRGQSEPEPCSDANLVLKWIAPSDYFVLTSYPDCR